LGILSISTKIVAPVVVTPETASKRALEYPSKLPERKNGIEPKNEAAIQHNTITKKTSLLENDCAFLEKYQTGIEHKIDITETWNKYKFFVSKYSIVAGISKKIDSSAIRIDNSLNVGFRLIIRC
jgi:hypothetical protein